MTVLGAYLRIDHAQALEARAALDALEGVSTFPLPDTDRLGVLVEAADVDRAHTVLLQRVARVPGVLGTWPITVHEDWPEPPQQPEERALADRGGSTP